MVHRERYGVEKNAKRNERFKKPRRCDLVQRYRTEAGLRAASRRCIFIVNRIHPLILTRVFVGMFLVKVIVLRRRSGRRCAATLAKILAARTRAAPRRGIFRVPLHPPAVKLARFTLAQQTHSQVKRRSFETCTIVVMVC